jgi:hypothetical protein
VVVKTDFIEWGYFIVEVGQSEICSVGQQAKDSDKSLETEFPLLQGNPFCS